MTLKEVHIIDDNPDIRIILGAIVEQEGYDSVLHPCYDFVPTPNLMDRVLAVFMDYQCPPIDGDDFLKEYELWIPASKRVLMSGGNSWEKTGYDGYFLSKPFHVGPVRDILYTIDRRHNEQ